MPHNGPSRSRRQWGASIVRRVAWLTLLAMLLGPFAPRTATARTLAEIEAELQNTAELDRSVADASPRATARRGTWAPRFQARVRQRAVMRMQASRVGPARVRVDDRLRVHLPRRVVPGDDDPDGVRA